MVSRCSTPGAPIHRIAAAVLVRGGQVLLAHRHPRRQDYPNCWNMVGGHIEPDETPADAIGRECREELGIDIDDPRPIPMTVSDPQIEMHAFVVTRWSDHPENTAPDEHDDMRWFDPTELGDLVLAHPESLPDIVAATTKPEESRHRLAGQWPRVRPEVGNIEWTVADRVQRLITDA